jgi:Domain of unknown function (DUF4124)
MQHRKIFGVIGSAVIVVRVSFVVALVLLASAPAHAMYKCTGIDGKASFQDVPCASGVKVETIRAIAGPAPASASSSDRVPPGATDWKKANAEVDARLEIQRAIEQGRAVRGMTRAQLDSAMGPPLRVNTGDYASGSTEQRIYEQRGLTWYVYTNTDVVTSVQTQQSVSSATSAKPCPGAFEIRAEEVSANSIAVGDAERAERQRRISKMKECGR